MSVTVEMSAGRSVIRVDAMGSFVPARTTLPVMETLAAAGEVGSGVRCWIGTPRNKNKRQSCRIMAVSYIDNRARSMVRSSHPKVVRGVASLLFGGNDFNLNIRFR